MKKQINVRRVSDKEKSDKANWFKLKRRPTMKSNRNVLKDIIGYGTGGVGENIAGNLFYTYFIFFLTSVAGINPAAAGTISLFVVAWDAITDPIIGYLNDRYEGHLRFSALQ